MNRDYFLHGYFGKQADEADKGFNPSYWRLLSDAMTRDALGQSSAIKRMKGKEPGFATKYPATSSLLGGLGGGIAGGAVGMGVGRGIKDVFFPLSNDNNHLVPLMGAILGITGAVTGSVAPRAVALSKARGADDIEGEKDPESPKMKERTERITSRNPVTQAIGGALYGPQYGGEARQLDKARGDKDPEGVERLRTALAGRAVGEAVPYVTPLTAGVPGAYQGLKARKMMRG